MTVHHVPKVYVCTYVICFRKVVQMEYDHSPSSKMALEALQGMSPRPWQCHLGSFSRFCVWNQMYIYSNIIYLFV